MQLYAALGNHKLAFAKVLKKSSIAKREESRGEEEEVVEEPIHSIKYKAEFMTAFVSQCNRLNLETCPHQSVRKLIPNHFIFNKTWLH